MRKAALEIARAAKDNARTGDADAFWAKELQARKDSKIDPDEEAKAMRAVWERHKSQTQCSGPPHDQKSSKTPNDGLVSKSTKASISTMDKHTMTQQTLAAMRDSTSAFHRLSTDQRKKIIIELAPALGVSKEAAKNFSMAVLVAPYALALSLTSWLFGFIGAISMGALMAPWILVLIVFFWLLWKYQLL